MGDTGTSSGSAQSVLDNQHLKTSIERGDCQEVRRIFSSQKGKELAKSIQLDEDGGSPLHVACSGGRKDICELLVDEFGANVYRVDKKGRTCLLCASFSGSLETVHLLIQKYNLWRQIFTLSKDGLSPAHIAFERCHSGILHYLQVLLTPREIERMKNFISIGELFVMAQSTDHYCHWQCISALESLTGISRDSIKLFLEGNFPAVGEHWKELKKSKELANCIVADISSSYKIDKTLVDNLFTCYTAGEVSNRGLSANKLISIYMNSDCPAFLKDVADHILCREKTFEVNEAMQVLRGTYPFHSLAVLSKLSAKCEVSENSIIGCFHDESGDLFGSLKEVYNSSKTLAKCIEEELSRKWQTTSNSVWLVYQVSEGKKKASVPEALTILLNNKIPGVIKSRFQQAFCETMTFKKQMDFMSRVYPCSEDTLACIASTTKVPQELLSEFFKGEFEAIYSCLGTIRKASSEVYDYVMSKLASKWATPKDLLTSVVNSSKKRQTLSENTAVEMYKKQVSSQKKAENALPEIVLGDVDDCLRRNFSFEKCFSIMVATHPFHHNRVAAIISELHTAEPSVEKCFAYLNGETETVIDAWKSIKASKKVSTHILRDYSEKWDVDQSVLDKLFSQDFSGLSLQSAEVLRVYQNSRCPTVVKELVDTAICRKVPFDIYTSLCIVTEIYPFSKSSLMNKLSMETSLDCNSLQICLENPTEAVFTVWKDACTQASEVARWLEYRLTEMWKVPTQELNGMLKAYHFNKKMSVEAMKEICLNSCLPANVKAVITQKIIKTTFTKVQTINLLEKTYPMYYGPLLSLISDPSEEAVFSFLSRDIEGIMARWGEICSSQWFANHVTTVLASEWHVDSTTLTSLFDASASPPMSGLLRLADALNLQDNSYLPQYLQCQIPTIYVGTSKTIQDITEFMQASSPSAELLSRVANQLIHIIETSPCATNYVEELLSQSEKARGSSMGYFFDHILQSVAMGCNVDVHTLHSAIEGNLEIEQAVQLLVDKFSPPFLALKARARLDDILTGVRISTSILDDVKQIAAFKDDRLGVGGASIASCPSSTGLGRTSPCKRNLPTSSATSYSKRSKQSTRVEMAMGLGKCLGFPRAARRQQWRTMFDLRHNPKMVLEFVKGGNDFQNTNFKTVNDGLTVQISAYSESNNLNAQIFGRNETYSDQSFEPPEGQIVDDAVEVVIEFIKPNMTVCVGSHILVHTAVLKPLVVESLKLIGQHLSNDLSNQTAHTETTESSNDGRLTKCASSFINSTVDAYMQSLIDNDIDGLQVDKSRQSAFDDMLASFLPLVDSTHLATDEALPKKLFECSLVSSFSTYLEIARMSLFSPYVVSFLDYSSLGNLPGLPIEVLRDNKPELCSSLIKLQLRKYERSSSPHSVKAMNTLEKLCSVKIRNGEPLHEHFTPLFSSISDSTGQKMRLAKDVLENINCSGSSALFREGGLSQLMSQGIPEAYLLAMLACLNSGPHLSVYAEEYAEKYRAVTSESNTLHSVLACLAVCRQLLVTTGNEEASIGLLQSFVMLRCLHQIDQVLQTCSCTKPSAPNSSVLEYLNSRERNLLLNGKTEAFKTPLTTVSGENSTTADAKTNIKTRWLEYVAHSEGDDANLALEPMEQLFEMVGIETVKEHAMEIIQSNVASKGLRRRSRVTLKLHFSFVGNSGIGKTTAANLVGKILLQMGLRNDVRQYDANKLKRDGANEFEKILENGQHAVLIINDAHLLDPASDSAGKEIVNALLDAVERYKNSMTVILTGKKEQFQSKLYEYDTSIVSHFQEITFHDFGEKELREMWKQQLHLYQWKVSKAFVSEVVIRRLARRCGTRGFTNAREVRNAFEAAFKRATKRTNLDKLNPRFVIEDILGPRPSREALPDLDEALLDLDKLIGLEDVKRSIYKLVNLVTDNYERELAGLPIMDVALNRLMFGNPGTGKTTVAKIYARVLKAVGLVSKADVELKTAADFIGGHVGQTQQKTTSILEMSQGKVLLIDEAYCLNDEWYGKQAIDTIVGKVMGSPGEDIAILMCGYENLMRDMLRDQNPGLARRFDPNNALVFKDYNDTELATIMQSYCVQEKIHMPLAVLQKAIGHLAQQRQLGNFGNAGSVRNLLSVAKLSMNARIRNRESGENVQSVLTLSVDDIPGSDPATDNSTKSTDPLAPLRALQGSDYIVNRLEAERKHIEVQRREGRTVKSRHYIFVGAPGTGKTTVARCMGKMLKDLQLTLRAQIIETTAANLCGSVVGEAKKIVQTKLAQARGGVLFIDEAYQLGKGSFGAEAMTKLVELMTLEEYSDKTVIILAGYRDAMHDMLQSNCGLRSRFTEEIEFPDWTARECATHFISLADRDGLSVEPEAVNVLENSFESLKQKPGWANARDSNTTYYYKVLPLRSQRAYATEEETPSITCQDVKEGMEAFLKERNISSSVNGASRLERELNKRGIWLDNDSASFQTTSQHAPSFGQDASHNENEQEVEIDKRKMDEEVDTAEDEEERKQEKFRRLGKCPMSFSWTSIGNGWYRCEGGGHRIHESDVA